MTFSSPKAQTNNFNLIAPLYDMLGRIVFEKALLSSQEKFVDTIKKEDTVLIIGGGTGKILEKIPHCKNVVFLDLASSMIRRAKKRSCYSPVSFIHADFLVYALQDKYDAIICPFFLDCFEIQGLMKVITKIHGRLKPDGKLIITDFERNIINPFLLKAMLIFFKLFSKLETNKLLDIRTLLKENGFKESQISFYKKGIFSALYYQVGKRKQ
ncbi:class I SAM-dependent methyltransferase [Ekhidna sp.]|uniref:class I SAM-dependent methyltransferase n=1 Tax=Ekhidna sp. TaxID=2608089 RepID=UPI003BAD1010